MARKKSKVWNFFNIDRTRSSCKCKICGAQISYVGNTTNLRNHLLAKHKEAHVPVPGSGNNEVDLTTGEDGESDPDEPSTATSAASTQPEASTSTASTQPEGSTSTASTQSGKRKQTVFDIFSKKKKMKKSQTPPAPSTPPKPPEPKTPPTTTDDVTIKDIFNSRESYSEGKPTWNKITDNLIYMICKDYLPLSFTERRGFRRFMARTHPHYKIPGKKKIRKLIDEKYEHLRKKVQTSLNIIDEITLTTDIWTETKSTKSYISLTGHYYDSASRANKVVVLGARPLERPHDANYINQTIKAMIDEWAISDKKVVVCVTDNAANIVRAIKDLFGEEKHIACFAHTLNLVLTDAIAGTERVQELIDKIKAIVTYFKQNVNAADELRKTQMDRGVAEGDVLKLKQDVKTRFNSTLDMLERFVKLSDIVNGILLKQTSGPSPIDANDLTRVKELIKLLKPFKQATVELSGEIYATCSRVIPTVTNLKRSLRNASTTSSRGNNLQINLQRSLDERFRNIEQSYFHSICTFLDPRYKKAYFDSPIAVADVITKIKTLMKEEDKKKKKSPEPEASSSDSEKQGSDEDVLWGDHSKIREAASTSAPPEVGGLPLELREYMAAPIHADPHYNPFDLWEGDMKVKYPTLYKLARKFLPIAATSIPSERLFSKAGLVISEKRARLKPSMLFKLLFLQSLDDSVWNL